MNIKDLIDDIVFKAYDVYYSIGDKIRDIGYTIKDKISGDKFQDDLDYFEEESKPVKKAVKKKTAAKKKTPKKKK
jgi:5'-deoxynucleotidase YfbR-like HD superfamily hydrolase